MCDKHWEALAEIYIADKNSSDPDDYICCLCSRLYIRTSETRTILASEDASEGEDIDGDCVGEMVDIGKGSGIETQSIEKHDEEPVSCYCSASHTDNYYSTDEHDSVRDSAHWPAAHSLTQKLGLHQSDSGADLSEYHDQHEAKSIQNLVASYGKTFQTTETMIENNYESVDATEYKHISGDKESMVQSLSDSTTISNKETHEKDLTSYMQFESDSYTYPYSAFCGSNKSEMDTEWGKFWGKNGEQIIWKSWLEKYTDYIPDYFQNNSIEDKKSQDMEIDEVEVVENYFEQNTCFPNQTHKNCDNSNFAGTFIQNNLNDELKPAAISSSNSFLFEQMSRQESSDKDAEENRKKIINFEILQENGDGWNPLSPLSIEETYNQQSNAEDERLLTRCDSINGSIAKTNATSDSMTNVTKMTLTSSSCDSNSVHSFSLITSVTSSIESSITSSSSDQENEFTMEDSEKCWQYLWKENFHTQYQKHYEIFIANYQREHNIDGINCIDYPDNSIELPMSFDSFDETQENENETYLEPNKICLQVSDKYETDIWKDDKDIDLIKQDDKSTVSIKKGKKNSKSKEEKKAEKRILTSVGTLLKNLAIRAKELIEDNDADEKIHENQLEITKKETIASVISNEQDSSTGDKLYEDVQNVHQLSHFCPVSCSVDFEEDESSSDGLESVKKAFWQMNYGAIIENENQRNMQGEVVYRKRNIRRYTSNGLKYSQFITEIKRKNVRNVKSSDVDILKDAGEKIIEDTAELRKYLSYDSLSVPSDNVQHNDKGSYTKTQITSSSDDEDSVRNMQKKKKKKQFRKQNKTIPKEIANDRRLFKFYIRRHGLFSKYDEGIKLDHESWYSVTPEEIAKNIAKRCRCDTIIDAFCGAGSNSIQFAFTCERVIAIDIDPNKIENARHNARIYGVEDRIEFIIGDFLKLAPSLIADVVFLSPPWGGLDYKKQKVFDLESILPFVGGKGVFEAARKITDHVAYYLPKNSDPLQMTMLAGRYGAVEIEQNIFNGRFTACTAYYGELARI
ncbi:trimethylguanosine synthase isoform X2 [Pseudomyrmex gracilis]|uniref:trimethylguanosine synthase isoform X2 n=1 Tax=Pseudomyrmex gracilis TaxID=219809 RepID=UPI000994A1A2|nr:trimethylguanosine synthase isoform X2 [Pseudomyrmex gracilis]